MDFAAEFPRYGLRAMRAAQQFGAEAMRREERGRDRGRGRDRNRDERGGRGRGHGPFGGPDFGAFGGFGFGGFPFGGGPRQRRGSRASRGDIRLAALALLAEAPMHGYQLMREITARSDGMWRPSPGAMYPALQQLEDEGLIEPEHAEGKRVFRLTTEGTTYVAEHRDEIDAVWASLDEGTDDDWRELGQTGKQVMQAFFGVISAGNRHQIAAATELMADTRRRLYRILAEDDTPGNDSDGPADSPVDE